MNISRLAIWTQPDQLKPKSLLSGLNIQHNLFKDSKILEASHSLLSDCACSASAAATRAIKTPTGEEVGQLLDSALTASSVTNYAVDKNLDAASRLPFGAGWEVPNTDLEDLDELQAAFESASVLPGGPGSLLGLAQLIRGSGFLQDAVAAAGEDGLAAAAVALLPLGAVERGTHVANAAYDRWAQLVNGETGLSFDLRSVPGYLMTGLSDAWMAWEQIPQLQDTIATLDPGLALRLASKAELSGHLEGNPYAWLAWGYRLAHSWSTDLYSVLLSYMKGVNTPMTSTLARFLSAPSDPEFFSAPLPPGLDADEQALAEASFVWLQARPAFAQLDLPAMRTRGIRLGQPAGAGDVPGSPLGSEGVYLLTALTGLRRAANLARTGASDAELARVAAETQAVVAHVTYNGPLMALLRALG